MKKYFKKKQERFEDVENLQERVENEGLQTGEYLYNYKIPILKEENNTLSENDLRKKLKLYFQDLPISEQTHKALRKRNFRKQTEVQRCAIPHALQNRDLIVASKTGSGKTLTYVIPIIENLYRKKWTPLDGLGALIILPTRELAIQVFEVFKSLLENFHELSFGLIIGGKSLKEEQKLLSRMNILICTPGRFLQHLTESNFYPDDLQILVLDEADEILSKGFEETLQHIFESLPLQQTQNLLFSATLNKKVINLCNLTLKNPEKIYLQETKNEGQIDGVYELPEFLKQFYMMIPHEEKIKTLFSFLKTHRNTKIIVFVSCVKQVRFLYESFKKLKLGIPIFEYHGRQPQSKRTAIFFNFKEIASGVLLSTNISSRGLDIPEVRWVIQMDCPESIETYIHRIGRTARFSKSGKAILLLDPSEQNFIEQLHNKKYQIKQIKPNPEKQYDLKSQLQALCAQNDEIKYLAQRYFITFLKNIHKQKDKKVFNVQKINFLKLSESLGLIQTPNVLINSNKNPEQVVNMTNDDQQVKLTKQQKKLLRLKNKIASKKVDDEIMKQNLGNMLNSTRQTQKISRTEKIIQQEEDEDDFLKPKKKEDQIQIEEMEVNPYNISKRQLGKIKSGGVFGGKNIFDIDDTGDLINENEKKLNEYKNNEQDYQEEDQDDKIYQLKQKDHQDKIKQKDRVKFKREWKKKSQGYFQLINNFDSKINLKNFTLINNQ